MVGCSFCPNQYPSSVFILKERDCVQDLSGILVDFYLSSLDKKSNNKKKIIVRSYPTVWGGFGHGVGLLRTAVIWVRQPHRLKKKTPFTENLNMYKSKTSKMKVEEKKSSNLNQSSQELYLTL